MPMKLRKTPATKLVRGTGARYAAPALEKGLDVIELLARETDGLTLNEVARLLDRTSSELFRMVNALCRRGYIGQHDDRYVLTLKLFELARCNRATSPFFMRDACWSWRRSTVRNAGRLVSRSVRRSG